MATSPPNISAHSPRTRSRVSSTASTDTPEIHRVPNGRIARARSASALQFSEHNRRACWAAATGRPLHSRPFDLVSEPEDHLAALVTPDSLSFAPTNTCALSTSTLASLEAISSSESRVSASVSSASSILEGSVDPQNLKNSMEFMMPAQYSHFASYPSSYQSSYMEQYTNAEQQQGLAQASPQPSSYAPSYATSSPMIASSPVTSQRASSRDREQIASQHYQQVVPSPYDQSVAGAQGNYGYAPTPSPAAPIQYTAGYATGQDPYTSSAYGVGYQQMPGSYLPPQNSGYGQHYAMNSSGQPAAQIGNDDPSGVRVVTARPKPQCWEHGCNGRQFSTFSNLLRHQREKSGTAAKSECPRCGAVFTRTTARNGHLAHDKCKRKSTASASEVE